MGMLDDEPNKQRKTIHGVPVLGLIEEIERTDRAFDEILIAIPSAKGEEMRRIVALCEKTGNDFGPFPAIGELIDGKVSINASREVNPGGSPGKGGSPSQPGRDYRISSREEES